MQKQHPQPKNLAIKVRVLTKSLRLMGLLRWIFQKFSGRHYRKFIESCQPTLQTIRAHEQHFDAFSDEQFRAQTEAFKARYANGETLDALLPEAFALVRSAARKICGHTIEVCGHELIWEMVHYDVQLIGGIALHSGKIAEMATGEGKTLVATLPLYLNALTGKNCQLITVNDYLARRDAQWMGYLLKFLGLTVGCIQMGMNSEERRAAYACDITYGTASEFGFDYLRDNGMALRSVDQVQRGHYFCIIDEVDSILVDEARTPLIISGFADEEREAPFDALKSGVAHLVRQQMALCNRLAAEAKDLLEKCDKDAETEGYEKLFLVKLGMPRHRMLAKILETGKFRKGLERFETEMNSDLNRDRRHVLKEALYFNIDEKQHQADLTELGRNALCPNSPDAFVLPDLPTLCAELDKETQLSVTERQAKKQQYENEFLQKSEEIHCLSQLLRAYCLYERDRDYVVMDGKVVIVDEHTGRAMPGRRWSDGLHQAVEAKEGVEVERESKTYATITIQNYFRMYEKLSGMTGTAETEAQEFYDIYRLNVMVVPTHKECRRKDEHDVIYKTRREKYHSVIKEIEAAHQRGQPVLVGTASVESSELLSKMLKRVNIQHNVLNAKFHQQEADIVAKAGEPGAVTIATNMAGRGTDIKLGFGVPEIGGLFVIGTERHESRRIDRQLRGRCARQGDPGLSKFFVSLEDDLMRLFANAGPISRLLDKTFQEGEELSHPLLNRSIETAQKKVEGHHYTVRKRLLQYDNVLNRQREVVYGIRNEAICGENPRELMFELVRDEVEDRLAFMDDKSFAKNNRDSFVAPLIGWLHSNFPVHLDISVVGNVKQDAVERIVKAIREAYVAKEEAEESAALKEFERYALVRAIDKNWQDHLTEMEDLRRSVGLRGYGQKDPLEEYKSEAFVFFEEMMRRVRHDICRGLFRSATSAAAFQNMVARLAQAQQGPTNSAVQSAPTDTSKITMPKIKVEAPSVGRNDTCPCGSNKKYKKCCGAHL